LEYGPNNALAKNVYGKGIDEILMRTDPGANNGYAIYYAQDHEGSVTHLLDGRNTPSSQTGNVIEHYKYDSFGAPTFLDAGGNQRQPNATAYNNRFLFTGREYAGTYRQQYVPAFTFYEYRARAYDPTLGRFMSEDPKGFDAGDYNFFRYCHNDPIDLTDPMGLASEQDLKPTINHNDAIALAEKNLARLQGILNQKLMLGYGAAEVGPLQSAVNQMAGQFTVSAQPLSVRGRDPSGASGSVFTIQFRYTGQEEFDRYALKQDISEGSWDSKTNQMVWSKFVPDTAHPLSNQHSTKYGITATDQAGKWEKAARPGTGLSALVPVAHFNKFGQMMKTSAFGIPGDSGNSVFLGSHTWGAVYEEGHMPQYQGISGY
jgi:RHS repeat-associated protein